MIHTYTEEDIRGAVTARHVAMELPAAFRALATGDAQIQARQRMDCANVKLSGMGAVWASRAIAAYKTYTTLAGEFNFLINLFDLATRDHHVMPAEEITRIRTAAMTCWVASHCVPPGARRKLALFGLGVQGSAHLAALQQAMGFSSIDVVDTSDVSRACAAFARELDIPVRQAVPQEAVSGADLVVTTTRSKQPLFDGNWLKPGATVCAVGTSLPNGSELDRTTRARAGRMIVEWKPQSLVEAGEVVHGLADGSLQANAIIDLPQISAQQAAWRVDDREIIIFKAVGVGLSDLVAAHAAVRALGRTANMDAAALAETAA
jgi:ornithine cyclodeaminase